MCKLKKGDVVCILSGDIPGRLGYIHGCVESDKTASVDMGDSIYLYFKRDLLKVTKQTHPELFI